MSLFSVRSVQEGEQSPVLHDGCYIVFRDTFLEGHDIAFNLLSIYSQLADAFLPLIRVLDRDMVLCAAELAVHCVITELRRHTRIDLQAFIVRLDSQDILGDVDEGPGSSSGEPAVLALSEELRVFSGDHLAVDVGLGAVHFGDVFNVCRAGLSVDLECPVAVSADRLRDGHPRWPAPRLPDRERG